MNGCSEPRVRFLTRSGCHLCDQALTVVQQVCAELGESYAVVDIDAADDAEQLRTYSDQVPVTFVDGRQHDFWRVDPRRLRAALAG